VLAVPPVTINGKFQFSTNQGYSTTAADNNQILVYGNGATSHPSVTIDGTNYRLEIETIIPTTENNGVYSTVFLIPSQGVKVT